MGLHSNETSNRRELMSLQTYRIRCLKHAKNGIVVANYLAKHPKIEKVMQPLLDTHLNHEIHKRQSLGFGGLISVYIKGDYSATMRFINALKFTKHCISFGGAGTTVDL